MAGTLKNFYETLGVSRSATDEQIKTAYRKLILKFHPDKNVGDAYFEDWSKKVIEAFEVLSDPQLRAEYDLVYDQQKQAAKLAAHAPVATEPEPQPEPQPEEEPEASYYEEQEGEAAPIFETTKDKSFDSQHTADLHEINKALPGYLAAKLDYLKAEKNYNSVVADSRPVKRSNIWPVAGICLLLIAGSVAWIIKKPFKDKVVPVAEDTAVSISQRFVVASSKAYFYKDPQNQVLTRDFLTQGMKVEATKKYKNFYYSVFQSKANSDYKLAGWLRDEDLQPLQ